MSYPSGALRGFCTPAPPRVTYEYLGDNAGIVFDGNVFHLYGFNTAPIGSTPVVDQDGTLHWEVVATDFRAVAAAIADLDEKIRKSGHNVNAQLKRLNDIVTDLINSVAWLKVKENNHAMELNTLNVAQKLLAKRMDTAENAIELLNSLGASTCTEISNIETAMSNMDTKVTQLERGMTASTNQMSTLFAQIASKLQTMNILTATSVSALPIPGNPTDLYSCDDGNIYQWDAVSNSYKIYNTGSFSCLYGGNANTTF